VVAARQEQAQDRKRRSSNATFDLSDNRMSHDERQSFISSNYI
jgi:hypothetical protein